MYTGEPMMIASALVMSSQVVSFVRRSTTSTAFGVPAQPVHM
jgi:hypothetical protein